MSVMAKIAAIEIVGDEVRLAVVKTGGRRPKILELHACRAAGLETGPVHMAAPVRAVASEGATDKEDEPRESGKRFDALVRAVEHVVGQVRTRPVAYVLCVPSECCITRSLTIPFRGARRVAAAVPFELEPFLAFPIEELIVDFVAVQEVEGETEVLTVGIRRAYLREQLDILEAVGIEPEGIGLDGIGLTALWQGGLRRVKGLNAVLHIREGSAVFAIVNGKNLAYLRHLSVCAADARGNPTALVRQIQNSIRAFLAGWRGAPEIAGLTVTGMELFEEERALLEDELGMPVAQENLFERLKRSRRARKTAAGDLGALQDMPEDGGMISNELVLSTLPGSGYDSTEKTNYWTAAIGVAVAAAGGAGYSLNFRKGDLAWPDATRALVSHALFSSCLALLALVGLAWRYHEAYKTNLDQASVLRTRIEEISQEIDEIREAGIDVSLDLFTDPPLLDVLAELGDKMPDSKVRITELRMARVGSQDEWITVTGEVKNEAVFAEVVSDVKQSSMFRVEDDPQYRMEGGKSTFTLRLKRPVSVSEEPAEES